MQSDAFQIVLNKSNCSGRGVRLRTIGPNGRDAAAIDASKLVDENATGLEYSTRLNRELLKRSLVAVTDTTGLKSQDDLLKLKPGAWKTYEIGELETGKLDELFTSRDYVILMGIMRQLYDASQDDVNDIMGGALPVSEG